MESDYFRKQNLMFRLLTVLFNALANHEQNASGDFVGKGFQSGHGRQVMFVSAYVLTFRSCGRDIFAATPSVVHRHP